ncbi:hypothetical protein HMPREF1210_00652 [Paenisporosarcina sp. HGH0030]|uniref:PepSY domain-containing protein n=1 Tax=Paenisporosarcina sp. HGH0030 TaxID=1078085 RepID=UPI00034E97A5|nr:PepSY domain-containing protein [Paenisporosarcina sp. HGH0030]EPD53829.1 hypothetical protein HMPREF1210_00652 [Paenisporosarcina sp. HGH0030]
MRKKLIIPALALTLVGGAVVGTSHMMPAFAKDNTSNTNQEEHQDKENSAQLQKSAKISSKEAEAIALKKVPGTVKESELEEEDGVLIYGFEVQTTSGDVKDVKVNAKNGDIFKVENDDNDEGDDEGDGEENDDNIKDLQKRASLSSKEAEAIALKEVPGTVKDSELEDEDGVVVYDFEVQTTSGVKDVKVNAENGDIFKVENENNDEGDDEEDGEENDDNIQDLQKSASLSSKEAEAIALKEVPGTVKDSELEDEDGVVVYDVEVKKSAGIIKGVKVDASSGKIIKVTDDEDNDDEVEND